MQQRKSMDTSFVYLDKEEDTKLNYDSDAIACNSSAETQVKRKTLN